MQAAGHRAPAVILSGVLALLAGCASGPDIIQVGPWFKPRPAEEVEMFASREDTRRPWGAIAIIHSERFPAADKAAVDRIRVQARRMAAKVGADGLILAVEAAKPDPELTAYQEPEAFVSALAFKYAVIPSTPAAPAAR